LNDPAHPGADMGAIPPEQFPAHLAHRAEVAARYFPGGSEAPTVAEFVAAREKEGPSLGNILKGYGFGHPNLGRWLSRIPNETLIVWGDKDRMLPASQADIWVKRIPHARLHIVQGVGHFAMQEDPRTVKVIGDFLAE
jgi:pimeloyl-ACP methyl ester carboxylesterase